VEAAGINSINGIAGRGGGLHAKEMGRRIEKRHSISRREWTLRGRGEIKYDSEKQPQSIRKAEQAKEGARALAYL